MLQPDSYRCLAAEVDAAPGFACGPGGLFKCSFYDQAQKGWLRVIGSGRSYWSCIHVQDLASAYVAALERAPAGGEYNIVDDTPLPLRALVDASTDAMGKKRVGHIPAWLMALPLGGPLVQSLVTSFRVSAEKARRELGWAPRYPSIHDGLRPILAALSAGRAG
jgi:nucleoside-diphosphate-sugar epimerase